MWFVDRCSAFVIETGHFFMEAGEIVVSPRVNGISGCGDASQMRGNFIVGDWSVVS